MKPIQIFSDDYLEISRKSSPTQIVKFLENFRYLQTNAKLVVDRGPSKLISLRLPLKTLSALKSLARSKQMPYQTLIKQIIDQNLTRIED